MNQYWEQIKEGEMGWHCEEGRFIVCTHRYKGQIYSIKTDIYSCGLSPQIEIFAYYLIDKYSLRLWNYFRIMQATDKGLCRHDWETGFLHWKDQETQKEYLQESMKKDLAFLREYRDIKVPIRENVN